MTTREQLLKRWAELEPERCNAEHGLVHIARHIEPDYEPAWHGIGTPGVVLAGAIEAIDARPDWHWDLYGARNGHTQAIVWRWAGPFILEHAHAWGGDNAEDALLTALVDALEAAKASADTK